MQAYCNVYVCVGLPSLIDGMCECEHMYVPLRYKAQFEDYNYPLLVFILNVNKEEMLIMGLETFQLAYKH